MITMAAYKKQKKPRMKDINKQDIKLIKQNVIEIEDGIKLKTEELNDILTKRLYHNEALFFNCFIKIGILERVKKEKGFRINIVESRCLKLRELLESLSIKSDQVEAKVDARTTK